MSTSVTEGLSYLANQGDAIEAKLFQNIEFAKTDSRHFTRGADHRCTLEDSTDATSELTRSASRRFAPLFTCKKRAYAALPLTQPLHPVVCSCVLDLNQWLRATRPRNSDS
ncbi:hypothetical protein PC128_g20580 [Phytophthora cactorum]|nr:hypothetical protein PC128_g20580 [Phytophthora cactorum]